MKYEVEFDDNSVNKKCHELYWRFCLSEDNFKVGDLVRNIANTTSFECTVRALCVLGANTDVGTYNDDGYSRIGYARINSHEFVKNSEFKYDELKRALMELAHPEE